MPPWLQNLISGWPMIRANLPTFFVLAVLMFVGVWWLMDWRYSGVIAGRDSTISNKDSEISLLKGQRDDYKDKLGGASPDQAKQRIDALEARLARMEPRRLTPAQRATLIANLKPQAGIVYSITVISEMGSENAVFAADFSGAFSAVGGWHVTDGSVVGPNNRPQVGLAVRVANPQNLPSSASIILNALRQAGLQFELQQFAPSSGADVEIFVSTKLI